MKIWRGIVEDNTTDPLKMGRLKVRIFGKHTESRTVNEDNNKYPVSDLPWAYPGYPITSPTISEEGTFSVPNQGSIVVGFFLDNNEQIPMYFAVLPTIVNELPDFSVGFSDPDGVYPTEESIGRSPIHRLATVEDINDSIVQTKKDGVSSGDAGNGVSIDEPMTPYNATYPRNKVITTSSGHVIEIDDSPGAERIHVYHTSGSFEETHPNGKRVEKTVNDKYEIDLANRNVIVEGADNVNIKGTRTARVNSSDYLEVGGTQTIVVTGNTHLTCLANVRIDASADVDINGGSGILSGVVTRDCICAYTGQPHSDYSGDVNASK